MIVAGLHSNNAWSSFRYGDTLLVTKIDRLARSTSDLYRIVSELTEKGVSFKVLDDPSIDTTSRTGKLVMGILALIAEFENDIRRERQMDGIAKAKDRGVKFGRKRELTDDRVKEIITRGWRDRACYHQADRIQQGKHLSSTEPIGVMGPLSTPGGHLKFWRVWVPFA